jgi:hypothetical protein
VVEGWLHGCDSAALMGRRRAGRRTARHTGGSSEAIGVFRVKEKELHQHVRNVKVYVPSGAAMVGGWNGYRVDGLVSRHGQCWLSVEQDMYEYVWMLLL